MPRINNAKNFKNEFYATQNWVLEKIGGSGVVNSIGGQSGTITLSSDLVMTGKEISINSGTDANQFLKFTEAGKLPALDGSLLTSLNASQLTSGTVPEARLTVASTTEKGIIQLATSAEVTAGTDDAKAVTAAGLKVELDKKVAKVAGTTDTLLAGDATGNIVRTTISKSLLESFNEANKLVQINSDGKIPTSLIPQVAINDTFVIETAESGSDLTAKIQALVTTGIGGIKAERGDIVIVNAGSAAGNYIILNTSDAITDSYYQKLYVADGIVTSINGMSGPTVTLNLSDIADVTSDQATLLKGITVSGQDVTVGGVILATKASVTEIDTAYKAADQAIQDQIGTGFDSTNTIKKAIDDLSTANTGLGDRIDDLEAAVGDSSSGLVKDVADLKTTVGDSTSGLVKDVNDNKAAIETLNGADTVEGSVAKTVKDAVAVETNRATAEEGKLKTAVEKAVQFVETSVTVSQTDASVAATAEIIGRLVAIYDADGSYVYPDVVYNKATGESTITVDFGAVKDEIWTAVVAQAIVVA